MSRFIKIAVPVIGATGAGSLFFHWGYSTLVNMMPDQMGPYNYSFLWLFEHFWSALGIDLYANIDAIGQIASSGLNFVGTIIALGAFLGLARVWTWRRFGIGAVVALLCTIGHGIIGFPTWILFDKLVPINQVWVELMVLAQFIGICAYVTAPKQFWTAK